MGRRRVGQRDGKKVGLVKEWEEGGRGRGMGGRRVGQMDGEKEGGGEGLEEGGRGKGMGGRRLGQRDMKKVGVVDLDGWQERRNRSGRESRVFRE